MIVTILGVDYTLPDSLADITLSEFLAWSAAYGKDLESRRQEIARQIAINKQLLNPATGDDLTDTERPKVQPLTDTLELEKSLIFMDTVLYSISHFGHIPLPALQNNVELDDLINLFLITELVLATEQGEIVVEESYEYDGFTWIIGPPYSSPVDELTHMEFVNFMALCKDIVMIAEGDWSRANRLMVSFLKREGETDLVAAWLTPGNPRYVQMDNLPMNIGMAVFTYIISTMAVHLATLTGYYEYKVADETDTGEDGEIVSPP